jgi:hypothetical protein
VNGRFTRSLFAAFTNVAPGVDLERFHHWYFEMHRPDSLELGLFERSMRYEATSPSKVRFLTLWAADYASLDEALERVRPVALALRERGRIWPVQEVVFAQFLFLEAPEATGSGVDLPPRTLTTAQNDWRAPEPGVGCAEWRARALPDAAVLGSFYRANAGYAVAPDDAPTARRCLWIGESDRDASALEAPWRGRAEAGIAPLGQPTPIFSASAGAMPPREAPPATSLAPGAAWVVHWRPVPAPGSAPPRF